MLVALVATAAASAATPAQYRAHLNAVCRSYTPKVKRLDATITKAQQEKNAKAYSAALGRYLALGLAEDHVLETTPVPAALRARMKPIIALLRAADVHVRAAIALAAAGDGKGTSAELSEVGNIGKTVNPLLDAAGLRDCGSNQS